MLFKPQTIISTLACVLALGQAVVSFPQGETLNSRELSSDENGIERRDVNMDKWEGLPSKGTATWKQTIGNIFGSATAAKAKEKAKEGYEDVMKKVNSDYKNEDTLVAALYVPNKGIYLSSIPKKPTMDKMDPKDAPAWAARVSPRTNYHAEDAVEWLYEKDRSSKLSATDKYPAGSTMYVYGHFKDDKTGKAGTAGYQSFCSQSVTPSCTTVAQDLGITKG
ncbi:MAG: hypothetical protein M1812_001566 [Candelaria pacifica]|nr:MAG: hypothetical protein M1812_001566 [Candelaria pacifica]